MTKAQREVVEAARAVVANWRHRPHVSKSIREIMAVQNRLCEAVDAETRERVERGAEPS